MTSRYDAIIIGAGHNGLVTAAYLARAGPKVLVLERRELVGGCVVTEELWPGFTSAQTGPISRKHTTARSTATSPKTRSSKRLSPARSTRRLRLEASMSCPCSRNILLTNWRLMQGHSKKTKSATRNAAST